VAAVGGGGAVETGAVVMVVETGAVEVIGRQSHPILIL